MIEAAASAAPEALALITEGRSYTFGALAIEARRAASVLEGHPGPIAFVGTSDVPTIALTLAAIERGVPVLPIHPRWTLAERDRWLAAIGKFELIERFELTSPVPPMVGAVDPEATLAWFGTSGSTGQPKAVELSRRAFEASASAYARRIPWRADDRWLLELPLAHVGGFSILIRCLLARRAVVLATGFRAEATWARIERDQVTIVSWVPTMLQKILTARSGPAPASLRAVILGGAGAPAGLIDEARGRGFPIVTTYGLTEMASMVSLGEPTDRGHDAGRPLDGTEVRIVDGEIQVAGPTMRSGHTGRWLSTGDLGRLADDGRLTVLGRKSDLIISGGENVHPAEVEAVLLQAPGVQGACVVGLEDPVWGEVVTAGLVLGPGFDPDRLRALLEAELAPFKRPRRFAIVEAIPEGALGKQDRRAARDLILPRLGSLEALVSSALSFD